MPNGHGGFVRFGSAVLLLILTAVVVLRRLKSGDSWALYASFALAGLAAERLAWHLQMWEATEYGGAYLTAAEKSRARMRYALTALVLVVIALFTVSRILRESRNGLADLKIGHYMSARFRSSIKSFLSSSPIESRTVPGSTPCERSSASVML